MRQIGDQPGIVDGTDAVTDTLGPADLENRADALRPLVLTGMGDAVQTGGTGRPEVLAKGLVGRALETRKTERHHPALPAVQSPLQGLVGACRTDIAHDIGDQPDDDSVPLPRAVESLGERVRDLTTIGSVGEMGPDGEVNLAVENVLPPLLGQKLLQHQLEVLRIPQTPAASEIDVDEVLEIAKPEPLTQSRFVIGG